MSNHSRFLSRRMVLRALVAGTVPTLGDPVTHAHAAVIEDSSSAQIEVSPTTAAVDAPVVVKATGFVPGQTVTLHAVAIDSAGERWESFVTFVADENGVVMPGTQAPLRGSYTDADAAGMFWAMTPSHGADTPTSNGFAFRSGSQTISLTVTANELQVATTYLERRWLVNGVTRMTVNDQPFVGTFFAPQSDRPLPGVLVLGGSEGGQPAFLAGLLAAHGFATLSVAYFNSGTLPKQLTNIPLEYFAPAITWLQNQPNTRTDRIAVLGGSRGGELALLLGATYPQLHAVVGYVPSGVMWGGFGNSVNGQPPAAWTYGGQPLPFVRAPIPREVQQQLADDARAGRPLHETPWFVAQMHDPAVLDRAAIPVERIHGPILLVSGEADELWPSTALADYAVQRLKDHQFAYPVTHLHYPDAGHFLGAPGLPTTVTHSYNPSAKTVLEAGGTAKGYAAAQADSWPKVLAFLDEQLRT